MHIGLTYNTRDMMAAYLAKDEYTDELEEYDSTETIDALASVLIGAGHTVTRLGWGPSMLTATSDPLFDVDLVFNIAEGYGGRSREAQIPAFLDMIGVPYTGSDALALALSLDKSAAKRQVQQEGVVVPKGWLARQSGDADQRRRMARLDFPLIVKPAYEGSSMGINAQSVVRTVEELQLQIDAIVTAYRQPALVEEFIWGREVTIAIAGDPAEVLGVMEIEVQGTSDADVALYSLEAKRDWKKRVVYTAPAQFPDKVLERMERSALTAFHALGCRDIARVDYRIRPDGTPVFLEINPLPGLNPESGDIAILTKKLGITYESLIRRVLSGALHREYGTQYAASLLVSRYGPRGRILLYQLQKLAVSWYVWPEDMFASSP